MTTMTKQEFDIGDLVQLIGPIGANGEVGLVTRSKKIVELPTMNNDHAWHRDEYHCLIKLTTGECEWVRAKFLKILSKA